jgi:hypothetical protein
VSRMRDQEEHAKQNEQPYAVEDAEQDLLQAAHILNGSLTNMQPEEWLLLTTLVGEAYTYLRVMPQNEVTPQLQLLEEVVASFKRETLDFTDKEFLKSSRAARRHAPDLFQPGY